MRLGWCRFWVRAKQDRGTTRADPEQDRAVQGQDQDRTMQGQGQDRARCSTRQERQPPPPSHTHIPDLAGWAQREGMPDMAQL